MKRYVTNKLLITIIMMNIALFAMINYSVEATNTNIVDELAQMELEEDEVILRYDAKTGQTTEVSLEELKSNINQKYRTIGINTISAYEGDDTEVNIIRINNETGVIQSSNEVQSISEGIYYSVGDTSGYTNRAICRVRAFDSEGKTMVGSAYLAGPNLLVTAAHCIMDKNNNNVQYSDWTVYPGYYPDRENPENGFCYGGICSYETYYYLEDWHEPGNDWAICVLEEDLGSLVGSWLGTQSYGTAQEMSGMAVKAFGYPKVPGNGIRQMYTEGTLFNVSSTKFDTSALISECMSGGPIVRTTDDYVVGICKGYWNNDPDTGVGVRITQTIIDVLLDLWPE